MPKRTPPELAARKTITLPVSLWQEIADYRFGERIGSEAEAVRRLLVEALRARKAIHGKGDF